MALVQLAHHAAPGSDQRNFWELRVRNDCIRCYPGIQSVPLRQHCKEPQRKLPEVGDVDVAVAVEIEGGEEAGLAVLKADVAENSPRSASSHAGESPFARC